MKAAVAALVFALLLAGCSTTASPGETAARHAAEASIDAVTDEYEYLLFLGITGTEGPLNWTAYEAALRSASDPGASIADGFDQDRDHGVAGDGRLGSWLTTHFVFDDARQLLGGLYTQYSDEGIHSVYAPFRGPYAGTPALPGLQTHGMRSLFATDDAEEAGSVICGLVSSIEPWAIDSETAADIARGRSILQDHVEAYPEGEFTYYYFPKLDVEPGCEAELRTQSNYWVISHVDMDEYLAGGIPTMAEVRIDAATGKVLDESTRPLFERAPSTADLLIEGADPLMPRAGPFARNASIVVDPLVRTLDITVLRAAQPAVERSASTRLIDPAGRIWDRHTFDDADHGYRVNMPTPGRWTLEYIHHAAQPAGEHRLEIHVITSYS